MIEKIKGKEHLVIKRDGRLQKYSQKKLKKAINWCTNNSETLTNDLLNSLNLKIYNKIKIEKLWDEVIETAANKISELFPIWDEVAKKAYLLKIYKENYNIKSDIDKLHYIDVIKKGVNLGIYNKEIIDSFTEDEITELGQYIKKERDLNFTFIGLVSIMEKYSFNATKYKKLELPQHVYMRLAIYPFWKEDKKIRLDLIKKRYDDLSNFIYTEATPKMVNSLTNNNQMASCVLTTVDDNIESINDIDSNLAIFSKFGGGLACDISNLRCSGSSIGKTGGKSSGPVQFIKKFESTVGAFDQRGVRKGSAVITFPFWHMDIQDLVMLKDAGGSEDKRARTLQYTVKWYNLFSKRIKNGENITLFDPKEVPDLNTTYGAEFEELYKKYEEKYGIKKRKIPARDLAFLIAKVRSETGNIYIVFPDNINKQRIGEEPVFSSNLCAEITIPSKPAKNFNQKIIKDFNTGKYITKAEKETGEIGLCNLSSINLEKWIKLSFKEKKDVIQNLLRASDNLIDYGFYPSPDGELSNKLRRPIGIGVSNYANVLALNNLKYKDEKSLKFVHEIFEDLSFHIIEGSKNLAKERGAYYYFKDSKWSEGLMPFDLYTNKLQKFNYEFRHNWTKLKEEVKKYGVRFSYHMAIAPTACSSIETEILTTKGVKSFKEILKEFNIFYEAIKIENKQQWINLENEFIQIEMIDGSVKEIPINKNIYVLENNEKKLIKAKDLKKDMIFIGYENE